MSPYIQPAPLQTLVIECIGKVMLQVGSKAEHNKWEQLQEYLLNSLPTSLLDSMINTTLSTIEEIISQTKCDINKHQEEIISQTKCDINKHQTIEKLILASLNHHVKELDFTCFCTVVKQTLWKNLSHLPGLHVLKICTQEMEDSAWLYHNPLPRCLNHLLVFILQYHCTDSIVKTIASCCHTLECLDITWSTLVSDTSISYISGLKNLKEIMLMGTSVTTSGFQQLMQDSTATPIRFEGHEATKNIFKMMNHSWSNLVQVSLSKVKGNISVLKKLVHLKELNISKSDFSAIHGPKLLEAKGANLQALYLCTIKNISISLIGQYCKKLQILKMYHCVPQESTSQNFTCFPALQVFSYAPSLPSNYLEFFMSTCQNLSRLVVTVSHGEVDDELVKRVLSKNRLEKLEELVISGPVITCSMVSVEIVVEHCPVLKVLGNLAHWRNVFKDNALFYSWNLRHRNVNMRFIFQLPSSVEEFKSTTFS